MAKRHVEREDGKPFIWGWDDESIYFVFNPNDLAERGKRIQDHPELMEKIIRACAEYFSGMEANNE